MGSSLYKSRTKMNRDWTWKVQGRPVVPTAGQENCHPSCCSNWISDRIPQGNTHVKNSNWKGTKETFLQPPATYTGTICSQQTCRMCPKQSKTRACINTFLEATGSTHGGRKRTHLWSASSAPVTSRRRLDKQPELEDIHGYDVY